MFQISIITLCYNSSTTLERVYESLLKQTYKRFEWILVDDVSSDGGLTRDMMTRLLNEKKLDIKLIFKEVNEYGSRSAYEASKMARGKYSMILDHDDELLPGALATLNTWANYLDKENIDHVGICGRCLNQDREFIGKPFPFESKLATEGDVRFNLRNTSELFQMTKTEIITHAFKKMKPGYSNGFAWAKLSFEGRKYLYVNDVIRVYYANISTSASNDSASIKRCADTKAESFRYVILFYREKLQYNMKYTCQLLISYMRHSINANFSLGYSLLGFDWILKLALILSYPISWMKAKLII